MRENVDIVLLGIWVYLTVGSVYGVICHLTARSQPLRASCLGGFMWPRTEYIDRVFDGNFARKNSGKNFMIMMIIFGGIKLARDVIILVGRIVLLIFVALLTTFLIFYDWTEKKPKSAEEKEIMLV